MHYGVEIDLKYGHDHTLVDFDIRRARQRNLPQIIDKVSFPIFFDIVVQVAYIGVDVKTSRQDSHWCIRHSHDVSQHIYL